MAVNINPLSAISYTNKDFRSLIDELIDLTKKLTNKWDPSITNESDPAMILLKLDAIIGDKNNYNIDKNILEAFPETLTQEVSARSMYNQLAYHMPWYQSASTTIVCSWRGRELAPNEIVVIPKYTMVCNTDSTIVYTLMTDVVFNATTLTVEASVKQGIITDLVINGEKDILLTNLDNNNRIYFGDNNVAENGTFITNKGKDTYWEQKNNLQVEHEGNTFYEFGVDVRSGTVYVEFPEDIETLIQNGLNIKYLLCDGTNGNIAAKELTRFYEETSVAIQNSPDNESVILNADTVEIYNPSASVDGSNPQSIRDAFKSWKKVSGTYDTLITLRDYINAVYNTGIVSNDVVSDRLTDIQSSYKIMTDRASYSSSVIHTVEGDMTAYDLKLYLLHNPGIIDNIDSYEQSFELETDNSEAKTRVLDAIANEKSILHDFQNIKSDLPCMFRNLYQLRIKVVPQYYLNETQVDELKRNIVTNLFEVLNSRQMEFGEEPDYYIVYDTIVNSDERIKLIVLDDFDYTTYATYWDGEQFKSIPVSEFNDPYIITGTLDELKQKAKELNNPQRFLFIDTSTTSELQSDGSRKNVPKNNIYRYDATKNALSDTIYSDKLNDIRTQIIAKNILAGVTPLYDQVTTFKYTIDQQQEDGDTKDVDRLTTDLDISPFGYESASPVEYKKFNGTNTAEYKLKDNEILQFLAPSFGTVQSYGGGVYIEFIMKNTTKNDTEKVAADSSKLDVSAKTYDGINIATSKGSSGVVLYYYDEQDSWALKEIYANDLKKEITVNGVKMEFDIAFASNRLSVFIDKAVRRVDSGQSYRLQEGDLIAFFYKESNDDDNAPYVYKVYSGVADSSKNIIIKPSFTLNADEPGNPRIPKELNWYPENTIEYEGLAQANSSLYNVIRGLSQYPDNCLSGSKTLDIQAINQVTYQPNTRGYYFLTNQVVSKLAPTGGKADYYQMVFKHENGKSFYEYVLGVDEYFITIDTTNTSYEMLSYGSMIRLYPPEGEKLNDTKILEAQTVSYNDVAKQGTSSFYNLALFPGSGTGYPSGYTVMLREQQIFNFAAGDSVLITLNDSWIEGMELPHFETGVWKTVDNYSIKYKTAGSNAYEDLPKISVSSSEDENWRGTAILNIDASSTDAQAIDNSLLRQDNSGKLAPVERQSIQKITINDITFPDDSDLTTPEGIIQYLLVDTVLTKVGGKNVDVTYVNEYGERKNIDIFIYTLNPAFSGEGFDRIGESILLDVDGKSHTIDNIELELGYKYIMGIVNNAGNAKFTITAKAKDGTKFTRLQCLTEDYSEGKQFGSGNWYFVIDQQGITSLEKRFSSFMITFNEVEVDSAIIFEELIKCKDSNFFDNKDKKMEYGITFDAIIDKVSELDYIPNPTNKENMLHAFKYNYKVPKDVIIEDPLRAKTFFNENHVFNKYTIGQAQMRMAGYNENDSDIVMINNNK